jgi:hypothetical protein
LVAVKEFERGMESVGVLAGVMGEFYKGEEVGPRFGVNQTENGEVGLDFLIDSFGCSIGLGVEHG